MYKLGLSNVWCTHCIWFHKQIVRFLLTNCLNCCVLGFSSSAPVQQQERWKIIANTMFRSFILRKNTFHSLSTQFPKNQNDNTVPYSVLSFHCQSNKILSWLLRFHLDLQTITRWPLTAKAHNEFSKLVNLINKSKNFYFFFFLLLIFGQMPSRR